MTRTATKICDITQIDFSQIVRPGDTVMWTQGAGEPLGLLRPMLEQRHRIGPFRVFVGAGYAETVRLEHTDVVTVLGMGAVGSNRALCQDGKMHIVPCHLSDLPGLLTSGRLKVDVVLMQVSAPDRHGRHSVGGINGYVQYALAQARVALAEINNAAPWTHSSTEVDMARFDFAIQSNRALITVQDKAPSVTDQAIGRNIARFIDDGAMLQLGIGTVPRAVLAQIGDRRRLGLHAGVIGDAVLDLIDSGALDNSARLDYPGKSVAGALIGSQRLYDFAHENPALLIEPVTYTHSIETLRALPGMVAINSAIEVDLTGQVGSEVAGQHYAGTIGGQVDFVRGALASPGGRSIIGLPARTGKGMARIVPTLKSGIVTVPRADADVVVTEFGVAELRGKTIAERVQAMIGLAHPDDREGLARDARDTIAGY